VKGLARVSIGPQYPREDYYVAPYARCAIEPCEVTREVHALNVSAIVAFNRFVDRFANAPQAASLRLANRDDPGYTADYIAQNLPFSPEVKQNVLEETAIEPRLRLVTELLHDEVERISIEFEVEEKLHERMNEASRDNYLRERIRVMQEELGDAEDGEPDDYTARIQKAELDPEIAEKLLKENDRLRRQGYGSPEAALLRSYLDACLELPWHKSTRERLDIAAASRILEKDHYGLAKVKERILEYLAVRKLSPELKGGILCLV
ncbi:MAG: LON peptidase substrate-binding domain-containing protein, partial [bacterium]